MHFTFDELLLELYVALYAKIVESLRRGLNLTAPGGRTRLAGSAATIGVRFTTSFNHYYNW